MSETIAISYVWDRTITKILNYDLKSDLGIMIKEWVVFNKLEDFNSLLNYIADDFTPTGNLCNTKDCDNMLFIAYSILFFHFGKWDFMYEYHQCRIRQRGPTWVGHVHGPGS